MGSIPTNRFISGLRHLRQYDREAADLARASGLGPVRDFSLNVNPFGPPNVSVIAACAAVRDANIYPDTDLTSLRREVAEHHHVGAETLLFGCGLDEIIRLFVWACTNEASAVVIHTPTFPRYELECIARGAHVHQVRAGDDWQIDIDEISRAIELGAADLCFLCTPNNPTGTTIANASVADLAERFPSTHFVVDEAMICPLEGGAVPLVHRFENVAVLRTFSKYYGLAGLRIGYAIAHPSRITVLEAIRPPFNVSSAAAAAAVAALHDTDFLGRSRELFHRARSAFETALATASGIRLHGSSANMVLAEFTERSAEDVVAALARHGYLVADGQSFRGLENRQVIRISLRTEEENAGLAKALLSLL